MQQNPEIVGYEASTTCMGCDKDGKECQVIKFAEFTGPHCARCAMRETKKRKDSLKVPSPSTGAPAVVQPAKPNGPAAVADKAK